MDQEEERTLGFLKYSGNLVKDGYMDARKASQALIGFDEAVRFFIYQQAPNLRNFEFEFPVRIKKGSWEVHVPDAITLVHLAGGSIVTAYGIGAAHKMASNDFDNIGLKDLFKASLSAIQWILRLGKHIGDLTLKKFEDVKFKEDNNLIGIPNHDGEYLFIPKKYLNLYASANPKLLSKLAELIEDERSLSIGINNDGEIEEEIVTTRDKKIFYYVEEQEDMLFPELRHGESIALEGELTRGNGVSNTMGFGYKGHILTCIPESGSVVRFKASLFLKCRIHGHISRLDDKGHISAKKPRIIFTNIEPVKNGNDSLSLFD